MKRKEKNKKTKQNKKPKQTNKQKTNKQNWHKENQFKTWVKVQGPKSCCQFKISWNLCHKILIKKKKKGEKKKNLAL